MRTGQLAALVVTGSCLALLLWSRQQGLLSTTLLWTLLLLNLLAFMLYGKDKRAALRGGRRTPENTLHLLALLGGWPGALLAQQLFRHKTSKVAFRIVFWFTVLLNGGTLAWLHGSTGRPHLQALNRTVAPAAAVAVTGIRQLSATALTTFRRWLTDLEQGS